MSKNSQTKFKETEIGLIPEEWNVATIGDFCSVMTSGGTPSRSRKDYYQNGNIPWVKTKELNDSYVYDTEEKINEDAIKNSAARILPKDTVSMAMYGATVGMLGVLGVEASTNQACCNMITKDDSDFKFLFYSLLNKRQELIDRANGAAQQNLSVGTIKSFKLAKPVLGEQKQIAEILSSLDDKIELNRKINTNLEKLASSLFKKWFVDIGDELSDGWKIEPLDEIANFLNGLALQKYPAENEEDFLPVIKIRELNNGITDSTDKASTKIPAEYILKNGDIIFSWSGSLDVVIWSSGPGALNQHLFKVTSDRYPKWFYYQWTKYFLPSFQKIASDKAVTMGHIKRGHLTESKVLVPDEKTFAGMDRTMAPIIELVINNLVETRRLMDIRDSLLPRLMSGKVRVNI